MCTHPERRMKINLYECAQVGDHLIAQAQALQTGL